MRKIRTIVLLLVVYVFNITNVNAVCDTAEENRLRSLATNVRMSYEEVREELPPGSFTPPDGLPEELYDEWKEYITYFNVYIENITEDIYVEVKDKNSGQTKRYTYADSDNGVITIRQDIYKKNEYTVTVHPASGSECSGRLASHALTTPYYNEYYAMERCQDNKEYYLCFKYVDYDLPDNEEFLTKLNAYVAEKERKQQQQEEEKKNNSFGEFLKQHKGMVFGVTLIVVGAGVATTVVIVYRRRRVV